MKLRTAGISLLELTVSASLLGLLFMGGLQFLSDLLRVQTHISLQDSGLSTTSTLTEIRLMALLAAAQDPVIQQQEKVLSITVNGTSETLSFTRTATHWELRQSQQLVPLAQWSMHDTLNEPSFSLPAENLLKIQWPQSTQAPLLIWLRNQS